MRAFVCLIVLLAFSSVALACPTAPPVAVAVGNYCPAPSQGDPALGAPLLAPVQAPATYTQTTQVLRADNSYYNSNSVQLLRANNYNYRSRNVQLLRVDNHRNNAVLLLNNGHTGRTRASNSGNGDTIVNVQSRSGLFGLQKNNVAVKVAGGGPNVSVKAGGRGPNVSVKAGGGGNVSVKAGKGRGRGRSRGR